MDTRTKSCFIGLIVLGVALRVAVGFSSLGFVHPDEHQQYLEAANKIAYGYGVTFWEYERGIRHYLYPGLLAGALKTLDAAHVTSPVLQAQVIRSVMGLLVFGSLAWYSANLLKAGKALAGFALLSMTSFSPFFLFVGARTLSETAVIPLLVLMLIFLDRRSWLAGVLGGIMFAVRFQTALFVAPLFFAMLTKDVYEAKRISAIKEKCIPFASGCLVALFCVGLIDRLTWGAWFHSPIEYFRANVVEHVAASFGVSPWYQYFTWAGETIVDSSISIVPLLLIGAWLKPRYAFAAIVFVVAHSCIGHKEARFLWPAIPVVLILVSEGFEMIAKKLSGPRQMAFASVAVLVLLSAAKLQFDSTDWHMGRTESTSLALAEVGRMEQVKGVALVGGDAHSGNYFYLRKEVPYIVDWDWEEIRADPQWKHVNYLIAADLPKSEYFEPIAKINTLSIYRVLSTNW